MGRWRKDSHRAVTRALKLALALGLTGAAMAAPAQAATVISLTFDDGQATQYAVKAPLAAHDMNATFFVNSAKIGTSSYYMTWPQATALAADGNDIGGHTLTHANLTTLTDAQKRAEVCDDRQSLIARGFQPKSFAYPYGASDPSVQAIVRDCGYLSARRVGGIVSPNWCPQCGTPRAESIPPANAYDVRTPSFGSGELTLAAMQNVITQAELSGGGWVPFLFHGVCETATCGEGWVKPSTFSALLDWLEPRAAHGTVVRTMRQVIENAPPETSIGSKPPALTAERSASFTLSSNRSPVTFECSLDFGPWQPCQSPVSYSGLTVGGHSFRARARDQLGAVDPTPAAWTWTIEVEPGAGVPTVVSLTFDDAQATQYQVKQALADHDMNGTFFVNSEDVCASDCAGAWNMTWGQVEALAADGNEIGGHTLTHADLTDGTIPLAEKRRQVCEDHANLAARGFDPVSFAYPFGHSDATAEGIVEECGYASGRGAGDAPAGGETIPPLSPFRTRTPGHSSGELTLSELQQQITASENAGGGWVQLAFHGICNSACGEGWVKPATFAALLDWLEPRAADGTIVRTVREVMGRTNPETSLVSGPSGTVASTAASFAFSSPNDGAGFECRLDGGTWDDCVAPKAYSGLSQGSHTFAVRAVDGSGNLDPSPATRTWTIDTVAPGTTLTGGPNALSTTSAATFGFSSPDASADFECSLDSGAWTACDSPKSYAGLAEGAHSFAVRAVDGAGNVDASPATHAWTVDTITPDTAITDGPSGPVPSSTASFAFESQDGGAHFQCRLDSGAWVACTSPKAYTGLGEGTHTFSVRAIDGAGNVDGTPAARTWTVDTVAAGTSIDSGPAGSVSSTSATFAFSSSDGAARFECQLDGGQWKRCTSPESYTGLAQGSHTFSVKAVDPAGNADLTPDTRTWTVDTLVPDTQISSGPDGPVDTSAASFAFSSPENGAEFECRLDSGSWGSCASPKSYAGLAEGGHSFEVRAHDAAGNVDGSPATRSWTVDTVAPETSITGGPSGTVVPRTAEFSFSSADGGASFQCRLDGGDWTLCGSPKTYTDLDNGSHTFTVRAVDAVGNADATPATRTWSIDSIAPDTSISSGPSGTVAVTQAAFEFSSPETAGVHFHCRLDNSVEWSSCESPRAYSKLADGAHSFSVRAVDAVGNMDPTPATRTWIVDTTAPGTVIDAGPSEMTASGAARFEFSSAESGAGFECRLDTGEWAGCASPKEYSGLADGLHAFSVRAVDAAGNADGTPETKTWTIDTTPPDTAITAGPTGTLENGDALFWWSATEDGSSECRLDGDTWAPCSEPKAYSGLADGSHTFEVRASDELGNQDPTPAARTWTVQRPLPPPPPVEEPPPAGEETPPPSGGEPSPTTGTPDTGTPDTGTPDGGTPDSGTPDPAPPAEPGDDDRPPADAEDPEPDPAAAAYLRRVLVGAVKANKGKRLKRIVRTGKVRIKLPHSDVRGALRIELNLLPDPPGPAPRLGRARTRAPVGSRMLDELKLGKRARKRLARLWVAAIEISVSFTPDSGGAVHDRAVFLARR